MKSRSRRGNRNAAPVNGGEKLELFFDLAVDLLAVAGLDGCFHRISASVTEILGYEAEALVGRPFLEMTPIAERDRVWRKFARLAKGDVVRDFETQFLHRDGTYRWLSWNASAPVGDGMTYMAGRDITARREAERKLRESEERFHLAVNGTSDGLWDWTDVQTDAVWWSPRMYQLLGWEDGEIPSTVSNFLSALHTDDTESVVRALAKHFKRGRSFDVTCRMRIKQGNYRWIRVRGAATRDENGAPVRMAGSVSDVTESLETLDRLKRSEQLLQAMGALAKVGGWEMDAKTLGLTWSPEMAKIHGLSRHERMDFHRALALYPVEEHSRIIDSINAAVRHGTPWNLEIPLITPDGRKIWVHSQGRVARENGVVTRLYGAVQDITERKENERRLNQTLEEV